MSTAAVCAPSSAWCGRIDLGYVRGGARTELRRRGHRGPLCVQRPFYPEPGGVCHTYLLHPPGGIVGGDEIALDVDLGPGAHALLTTPGASKVYRSGGATARITQALHVATDATLEWLPQEAIYFDGARVRAATRVTLTADAQFIGWELACLGRPASLLMFQAGLLDVRFELHRDGRPQVLERLYVCPASGLDSRPASWREYYATGTLYAAGLHRVIDPPGVLTALRTVTDAAACLAGVSLLDDVIVCRALAPDALELRALFVALWTILRPAVCGRAAAVPRIWQT